MDLDNPIAEYLKAYHTGEAQAVTSRELETVFRIRGPCLRKAVNRLRAAGVPICSFASGYYYAETEEELDHTIRQLSSRIKCILHAVLGLKKARRKFIDTGQMSLPLGGAPIEAQPLGGFDGERRSDGAGEFSPLGGNEQAQYATTRG